MTNTNNTTKREKLSAKERARLKRAFRKHGSKTDFEKATGISRQTLINVLKNGSGLRKTLDKIREYISNPKQQTSNYASI
jgi:hypothetical protein